MLFIDGKVLLLLLSIDKEFPVLSGISVNLLSKDHNLQFTQEYPTSVPPCQWNPRIDAFGLDNFILLGVGHTRGSGLSTIHLRVYQHVHHFFIGWCGRCDTRSSLWKNWSNVQLL